MVMLAGCGKQEQLQESEAAKTLVNAINEDCKTISLIDDYGFKAKEIQKKDGQLHEVYESKGVTLSEAIDDEAKKDGYIVTELEIISNEGKMKNIILTSHSKSDNSFVFSSASVKIKEGYPNFNYKDDNANSTLKRIYSPKS